MNKRHKRAGFTLVELLVVIAIIGILASIVLPRVTDAIYRGQVAKAVSEIKNIETSLTAVLSDTGRSNFHDLLADIDLDLTTGKDRLKVLTDALDADIAAGTSITDIANSVEDLEEFYSEMFYSILRQGKNSEWAQLHLNPTLRQKLGNSYMELGEDSWGQKYKFWAGPLRTGPMMFRSYRIEETAPELDDVAFAETDVYRYDQVNEDIENAKIPGAPRDEYGGGTSPTDDPVPLIQEGGVTVHWYGYPAPKDLPVYVYSKGGNQLDDANVFIQLDPAFSTEDYALYGGGDDINNWDTQQGWNNAPLR
jgi:prepilin-type N-terminal cleavage/methylation domain-containing protein